MKASRIDTKVGDDGVLTIPDLRAGEDVEVIVLLKAPKKPVLHKIGWAKDQITILPGFDDPTPGIEDYM